MKELCTLEKSYCFWDAVEKHPSPSPLGGPSTSPPLPLLVLQVNCLNSISSCSSSSSSFSVSGPRRFWKSKLGERERERERERDREREREREKGTSLVCGIHMRIGQIHHRTLKTFRLFRLRSIISFLFHLPRRSVNIADVRRVSRIHQRPNEAHLLHAKTNVFLRGFLSTVSLRASPATVRLVF